MATWRHLYVNEYSWKSRARLAHAFEDDHIQAIIRSERDKKTGTWTALCGFDLCINALDKESPRGKCRRCLKVLGLAPPRVEPRIPPPPVSGIRLRADAKAKHADTIAPPDDGRGPSV